MLELLSEATFLLDAASGTWFYKDAVETLLIYYLLEVVDLILLFDRPPKLLPCVRSP